MKIEKMDGSFGTRFGCVPAASLFWGRRYLLSGGPHGCTVAEGVAAARGRAAGFVGMLRGLRAVGARAHLVSAGWSGTRVVCGAASGPLAWAMPPFSHGHSGCATTASHNKSAHADTQHQVAASRRVLCAGGLQR